MLNPSNTLTEAEITDLIHNSEMGAVGSIDSNKLSVDPAIPQHESAPDIEKMNQWVALHAPKERPMAQKIVDNLRYVSFDEFYQSLVNCADQLNAEYEDNMLNDDEIIIAVPFLTQNKSNAWVTSLLLPHLSFRPKKIFDGLATSELRKYLQENHDIKRILVADDASYSGVDLSLMIANMKTAAPHIQIDLVVPFITNKAIEKLAPYCLIWAEQKMLTLDEMPFTVPEKRYLDSQNISGYENSKISIDRLTLTYFGHKMADSFSIPEKLLKYGLTISSRLNNRDIAYMEYGVKPKSADFDKRCPFIPEIASCYKQSNPGLHLSDKDQSKRSSLRM